MLVSIILQTSSERAHTGADASRLLLERPLAYMLPGTSIQSGLNSNGVKCVSGEGGIVDTGRRQSSHDWGFVRFNPL
jgi:hypothetical protein